MLFAEYTDGLYRELEFPPAPPERPFVFVNMVSSIDGKAVVEKTERGLGSSTDQSLMRRLRAHADLVLTGAATFRASGAGSAIDDPALRETRVKRGLSPNPVAGLLVNSDGLDTSRAFFTSPNYDAVVFAGPGVSEPEVVRLRSTGRRVERIGAGAAGLRGMLADLRGERGVERLLVEGGPSVNAALLAIGAVDEFFVTLAGKIVGGRDTLTIVEGDPFTPTTLPTFAPISVVWNPTELEMYCRWRRVTPANY